MSVISVTFYDDITGKVINNSTCSVGDLPKQTSYPMYPYIEGCFFGNEFYIDVERKTAMPKLEMPLTAIVSEIIADGQPQDIISGITLGTSMRWPDGYTEQADGEIVTFDVDLAGFYTFRFTAIAFLDKEITIEAIAAT